MLRILKSQKVPFSQAILTRRVENAHMVSSYGQITPSMKESGSITKQMAKDNSGAQTETHMRVNGRTIRPMVSVRSSQTMAKRDTLAIGKMICIMAKVLKAGLTVQGSMVILPRVKRMGSARISGLTVLTTPGTGPTTR